MADISYIQKEDLEDSVEAMEAEVEEKINDSNLQFEESRTEVWNSMKGGGDERGGGVCDGGGGSFFGGEEHIFQIGKLHQHATSETSFNRQMVGRILVEMFRTAANNGTKLVIEDIMHCVQQVIEDTDAQVRSDLVEQLPHVAMICHEAPHLFGDVLHGYLLGIIMKYIRDMDNQVRQTAQDALLTLIKRGLLDNSTIENEVCPVIEFLSYMAADFFGSGISLMCKLAPLIGREITEKVFLDRYIDLLQDSDMLVRRICVTHFGEMCASVGKKALFQELFPIFIELCGDSVWGVRKACVDAIMPVSCCSTLEHRSLLANILAKHLRDESKWVRMSAFQILGPFISTFAKQFTEVTYNQNGELIFTSTQDNYFSIRCSTRYAYDGLFPTKCTMKNQVSDTDENTNNTFCMSAMNLKYISDFPQKIVRERTPVEQFRCQLIKDRILRKSFQNMQEEDADDTDKYNTFLYYYIPPDLPLDEKLVHAAKQSAINSITEKKDMDATTFLQSIFTESNEEEDLNTNGQNVDKPDQREEKDDCFFQETMDLLNDNICNLSMDKSDIGMNRFSKELNTMGNVQKIVPQELIHYFVSMADPEQCVDMGAEIPHHCAFSFPAVTLTLGRENWPYLKKAYQSLASAKQWKVRRTLASSIHEIAIILGEELTATDLLPIYDGFIKDLDEVRIGVLKHLATFLKILKPIDRCQYLPRLNDFLATDNEWNWRFREELATQLLEAVTLFSPNDVAQSIAPLSLQLLVDKIAAVRHVALTLVTRIVSHLSVDDALVTSLIREVRDILILNTKKWIRRQTYALLCAHLICNGAITGARFSREMLPNLISLSSDRVPNVRLAVARTLARNVSAMGLDNLGVECMEEVERILKKMRLDPDRDVRVLAGGVEHPLDVLLHPVDELLEQPRNILF